VDELKKYIPKFKFGKYPYQFQLGVYASIHNHNPNDYCNETGDNYYHFHLWIDLGFYYIEITIRDEFKWSE
jgi:hypothetical protein